MRFLVWALRAFVFFALFAFALNNQQQTVVHWFFGFEWHAPMVIVVLTAFAAGCAIGVLGMLPSWWRQRRQAQRQAVPAPTQQPPAPTTTQFPPSSFGAEAALPPRDVP
jgi:lipopolysaccharide assembly protein A